MTYVLDYEHKSEKYKYFKKLKEEKAKEKY